MAPTVTSGRVAKARGHARRHTTPHQKNHRWESFTTKISKLNSLDPLRKVRRHDLDDDEDISTTTSYFRNGVVRWADLNISKAFTNFKREVMPLCETLPQILHFQDKIMGLLAKYISAQDKESLEPLLELMTAFAHDLGAKFEKYYQTSLELLVAIASKPQEVDVIEWTFGALAWLFKYLSRLLVPDLRPTYHMLSGLLGKSKHPSHINRFAAESMSFLIKKAAAPSHRESALPRIVDQVRDDLKDLAITLARKNNTITGEDVADYELQAAYKTKHFEMYKEGIMTMFSESMKGPGTTLHSTATSVFSALLSAVPPEQLEPGHSSFWPEVCCGVLTNIIHHSNADSFEVLAEAILDAASNGIEGMKENPYHMALFLRLFGVMAGVRDGSRVSDWRALIKMLTRVLETFSKDAETISRYAGPIVWDNAVANAGICWNQAPMDALIPSLNDFNKAMTGEPLMKWYIPFCGYLAELNGARFRSLFQKPFQKFITSHWSDGKNEELLCVLLPKLVACGALPPGGEKDGCSLPQSWQDQIVSKFEELGNTPFPEQGSHGKNAGVWRDKCLPKYSALLRVLESTNIHPSTSARIAELLLKKLKLALRPSESLATEETRFIVSQGFLAYLRMSKSSGSVNDSLSPLLKAAAPRFSRSPAFLEALLGYEKEMIGKKKARGHESPVTEDDPFVQSLISNLATSSKPLRMASLQVLEVLPFTPDQESCLSTMMMVEQLPLDHQSPRAIALHLRRLAQFYDHVDANSWLRQAIPAYLFGMLTIPLSPVWDEAVEALKHISQTKSASEAITARAFEWLHIPSPRWMPPQFPSNQGKGHAMSDFVCSTFMALEEPAQETSEALEEPSNLLLKSFEEMQVLPLEHVANARGKALKVLTATPYLAEKRSRQIVPYLLSLEDVHSPTSEDEDEESLLPEDDFWSLADRKALIGVFSQFGNPKVLYRSQDVYQTLLSLLTNRDIEVQKLALKAIFTWKQAGVKPYRENLEFLLDDARFKNELTVFLQDENTILPQHRTELMPVLLRLLYGRATSKKGVASGRNGLHATRLAVIRNLSLQDIGGFLDIALGSLRDIRIVDASGLKESLFKDEKITPRKIVGFLNMAESIINELGTSIERYMDSCSFDWAPYQEAIVAEIVTPVINLPAEEMAQGISWTWRLLETWSLLPRTASILAINEKVLPKTVECVGFEKSKNEVRIFALGIVQNLVKLAQADETGSEYDGLVKAELLDPNADKILSEIGNYLRVGKDIESRVLEACVDTVVMLSSVVDGSRNARNLVDISTYLLNQPVRRVSPKVKGSLLLILEHYITLDDIHNDSTLKRNVYKTLSSLFSFFKDKRNRESLSKVLLAYATREPTLQEVARICADLNSYVEERLDEPDYDRRLAAFLAVTRRDEALTIEQWNPLLHNSIFFLNQDEEFGILTSNSVDVMSKFIDAAAEAWGTETQEAHIELLVETIMLAIHAGVKEPSETVRRETMRLLGHLAGKLGEWAPVSDLSVLLPTAEEDANKAFFSNILTPAISKQLQAVQLLTAANERNELGSKNISQIFLPLLEHFIWGRAGADDHGLGAQAAATIASLAGSLEWSQYRALIRRYITYLGTKPELHKQVIRLLDKVAETLVTAVEGASATAMEVDDTENTTTPTKRRLARTLPSQDKMVTEFTTNFLPPMLEHLHDKNEETVSARVPVAVILVKLLRLLPDQILSQQLPSVLTDICHILRSKAWESREMARNTLAKIACILGAPSFGFILKELRGALKMGTQLHVLSYTMHTLLLAVTPEFKQGDLDYCLEPMVAVIMDDVFGVTGQEKDAEGYITKMKEIKSSKSQDSMELIASTASIVHLVALVRPLQLLLMEKLNLRLVRKIDELLNRIANGLQKNPASDSRDTLIFCYEVVQEVYNSRKPQTEQRINPRLKRYLIQKGAKREDRGAASKHTYKLMRFSIDILRSVLRKHEKIRTAANLQGFLPIIGDAIVAGEEEVKIAAFKLLTVLIRVPSKNNDLNDLYKVASKDAIKCVAQSVSTTTELSQTALKLLAVILRDRRDVAIKDNAIDMLLGKLKDDLTEPLYRHVTFNFLRSALDRKVQTAVVYDTLDYVGTIMVTNDDKDTRDLARGAFFQFLREYPQKKSRWWKQIEFIIANLKYPREGGRISVMEVVHLLLTKSADEFVKETAAACFFPLILVLGNDDSERCRLAAGELVKEIFRKADKERLNEFLTRMRSWAEEEDNLAVLKLGFQVFGYYFEAREPNEKDKKDVNLLVDKLSDVLGDESKADWELINTALNLVHTLVHKQPEIMFSNKTKELWTGVFSRMSHERPAVKLNAVKLLARYLTDFASNAAAPAKGHAITSSSGQTLEQDHIAQIIRLLLGTLRGLEVDEALAQESVPILVFLARFLSRAAAEDDDAGSDAEEADGGDDFFKDGEEDEDDDEKQGTMTMRYIFSRLAAIIRRETPPRATALVAKLAAIEAVDVFCNQCDVPTLEPSLRTILRPLRNLTDVNIPAPFSIDELFKTRYESLKGKAQQIMDTLQQKLGTAEYTKQLLTVGEDIKERRQARLSKRKVQVFTAPEKWGRDKRRKLEQKKDRRKAKGQEHRSMRRGY
ncbi:U3 small nucleolar RNA-associated protein 20 [Cytospora mali]|uniref:U3 small nucleolar RNA-associated protein 20 n=1 Tax=Cytospora mali TaxID=578113 RepID=A0A194V152_CYTMA|nr:U3 small nucleolar RNA-associated protein 20 [Valsa mali var. pyri (nom. inval.)]